MWCVLNACVRCVWCVLSKYVCVVCACFVLCVVLYVVCVVCKVFVLCLYCVCTQCVLHVYIVFVCMVCVACVCCVLRVHVCVGCVACVHRVWFHCLSLHQRPSLWALAGVGSPGPQVACVHMERPSVCTREGSWLPWPGGTG